MVLVLKYVIRQTRFCARDLYQAAAMSLASQDMGRSANVNHDYF